MLTRRLLAPSRAATISFSLSCRSSESLFWDRWMRKTIRKVTIVVPVLMASCYGSERERGRAAPFPPSSVLMPLQRFLVLGHHLIPARSPRVVTGLELVVAMEQRDRPLT